jgi:actin-related protein 9
MFPGPKPGEWEPTRIRSAAPAAPSMTNGSAINGTHQPDTEMNDALKTESTSEPQADQNHEDAADPDAVTIYEEDPTSDEGAVYPLKDGRVENWTCFFALLTHVFNTLSPPFHTPVIVISQPCWSARDHELLTQFFFESFKIPAFCLMDAALTASYAYGVPTATVIDVGYGKCDVTAVIEFLACDLGRGAAVPGTGGQGMTGRLLEVLEKKGFNKEMCEQLKKSGACEVLPLGTPLPGRAQSPEHEVSNPAAAASTGAADSGAIPNGAAEVDGTKIGTAPRGPGEGTEVGEGLNGDDDENEGVLDVASIVARGNASEILAKREKERLEKAAAKKSAAADPAKPVRLRNSERQTATFLYEDYEPVGGDPINEDHNGTTHVRKRRREISVGVERFMAVSPPSASQSSDGILDTIATTIHNTILSVPDVSIRSTLWENLIILGNGSRIRGTWPERIFIRNLTVLIGRLHTCSPHDTGAEVHVVSVHGNHLHLRTPFQLVNAATYRRHQHSHSRSTSASYASPCWTWRQPASRCRYPCKPITESAPSKPAPELKCSRPGRTAHPSS